MGVIQDNPGGLEPTKPPPLGGSNEEGGRAPIGPPGTSTDEPFVVRQRRYAREDMGDVRFRRQPFSWLAEVDPLYFSGDEYVPSGWPAAQIWSLQQMLAKVGLLRSNFSRNTWDSSTREAYRQLLGLANAQGITADQALQEMLTTSSGEGAGVYEVDEFGNVVPAGGGSVPPLVVRHTDPTALRQLFRKTVIETLGEGWSEDQINRMVAAYNQVETERQQEAYNMDISGTGGEIADIPSPEAFIQSQVLAQDPVGVQTQEALGFTQEFMDLASSPAWGVG